ncbi:MAG: Ig-like domain-containing protein [Aggregatilineales bacterium]
MATAVSEIPQAAERHTRSPIERFDAVMGVVLIGLLLVIGIVIAGGDRAGVGVTLSDATTSAINATLTVPATARLNLRFTEAMDIASVHVHLTPDVPFTVRWSGGQLTVTPLPALTPGQPYTVTLDPGAHSQTGRAVQQIPAWKIHVEPLRIVYLAPAIPTHANEITNLWLVAPGSPPTQLTHSAYGVQDFAPSPDGRQIAFSQKDATGKTDLFLMNLADDSTRQITRCVNAPCRAANWSPDGARLVYERADSNAPDSDVRPWLLDLSTLQTAPLFSESRWLGKTPRWSPDGSTITVYDKTAGGIFLVDLASGNRAFLATLEDDAGQFAPGQRPQLAFRQLIETAQGVFRQVVVADYSAHTLRQLSPPDGALVDDPAAVWNPDGKHLTVMRNYQDGHGTPGAQVYELDALTGEATPLVVDPAYAHGYLTWSPDGGQLLMQRYPLDAPAPQTGIWTYDAGTKSLTQVANNGFFPQWLP